MSGGASGSNTNARAQDLLSAKVGFLPQTVKEEHEKGTSHPRGSKVSDPRGNETQAYPGSDSDIYGTPNTSLSEFTWRQPEMSILAPIVTAPMPVRSSTQEEHSPTSRGSSPTFSAQDRAVCTPSHSQFRQDTASRPRTGNHGPRHDHGDTFGDDLVDDKSRFGVRSGLYT